MINFPKNCIFAGSYRRIENLIIVIWSSSHE